MRRVLLICALLTGLAGCQLDLPFAKGGADKPSPITGDAISVTPLEAPPATESAPAKVEAEKPAPAPETPPAAQPEPTAQTEATPIPEPIATVPKSPEQIACERRSGTWAKVGKSSGRSCVQRTRDAGQQCRRETDCEGRCLARSGTCAPLKPLFGCNDILQADGRQVTLCID